MSSNITDKVTEKLDWLSESDTYENIIFKKLVLGYVVIETNYLYPQGNNRYVAQKPILSSDQGEEQPTDAEMGGDGIDLTENDRVIGVLPAPFPTYQVNGFDIDGCGFVIGYEQPGLPSVDWVAKLKDMWEYQLDQKNRKNGQGN